MNVGGHAAMVGCTHVPEKTSMSDDVGKQHGQAAEDEPLSMSAPAEDRTHVGSRQILMQS